MKEDIQHIICPEYVPDEEDIKKDSAGLLEEILRQKRGE
jgi:hypothetical protein